jgi:hypothetical protein
MCYYQQVEEEITVGHKQGYVGWLLPVVERDKLLEIFPAAYPMLIAHHCTLQYGVKEDFPLPTETWGEVMGESVDDAGVQALVVRIGGTVRRPSGGIFHITWSLRKGRRAAESNNVIATHGWLPCDPIKIDLVPQWFPLG